MISEAAFWYTVALAVLAWIAVAVVIAVLVGRTVRARDRQRPDTPIRRCQNAQPHRPHQWRPFALEAGAHCPGVARRTAR